MRNIPIIIGACPAPGCRLPAGSRARAAEPASGAGPAADGLGLSPAAAGGPGAPYLPLPDRTYLRWRMYTAYADEDAVPPVEDVVRFARWRRQTMGLMSGKR